MEKLRDLMATMDDNCTAVCEAICSIEKATAIFDSIFNDLDLDSNDVTDSGMFYYRNRRESIVKRWQAVKDYLTSAYKELEGVEI